MFRALRVALPALILGCAARQPAPKPAHLLRAHVRAVAAPAAPLWVHWAEAQRWSTLTPRGTISRGHLAGRGAWLDVRVDPANAAAYRAWVRDSRLAPGAIVVALLRDPKTGLIAVAYAMQKRTDGTWDFLVLSAAGAIEPIATNGCVGCHTDALADSLFGPPQPSGTDTESLR